MAIPTDNSISVKEYNNINKFENLETETEKMCHLKTSTVYDQEGDR